MNQYTSKQKIHYILRQLIDLLICIIIGVIVTIFFTRKFNFGIFIWASMFGAAIGITLWKGNQYLGYFIQKIFPWEENPMKALIVRAISTVFYSSIAIFSVNYIWSVWVFKQGFINENPWLINSMAVTFIISITITLSIYSWYFFQYWREGLLREEKLKQEALQSRYEAIKNQVNPHFLFNSLNVLTTLVETDQQLAVKFIKQLSEVYRYVLDQKDKELVNFDTEFNFLKSYLFLHQIRFEKGLILETDSVFPSAMIVPLALQMLAENAIKHNIISAESPLCIGIGIEGDYIEVRNNLQLKPGPKETNNIGLANISERYKHLTGRPIEIVQNQKEFIVRLPIIKVEP